MGKYLKIKYKHRIQKMFLHQNRYEVHTQNVDIFYYFFSVCEVLKRYTSGSDFNITLPLSVNFGIQLPSFNFNKTLSLFASISLCKKFLRCMHFTAVAY